MTKIDKIDIENINFIKKELKLQNVRTVKIKKGNYEIEISTEEVLSSQNIKQLTSQTETTLELDKNKKQKTDTKLENIVKSTYQKPAMGPKTRAPSTILIYQVIMNIFDLLVNKSLAIFFTSKLFSR